jgi:hypothetical protein
MTLDGKTVAGNPRRVHDPHAVALALLDLDAAPGHVRPSDIASGVVDEARVGNTFVGGGVGRADVFVSGLVERGRERESVGGQTKEEGVGLTAGAGVCHQSASVMIVSSLSTSYSDLCGSSGSYGICEYLDD